MDYKRALQSCQFNRLPPSPSHAPRTRHRRPRGPSFRREHLPGSLPVWCASFLVCSSLSCSLTIAFHSSPTCTPALLCSWFCTPCRSVQCGLSVLTERLKRNASSCREASVFLKRRAAIEEEYGRQLAKLARTSNETYSVSEGKTGYVVHFLF